MFLLLATLTLGENLMTYYVLRYNDNLEYLYSKPSNHEGYLGTPTPTDAMHWRTKDSAERYLESFQYKDGFHVQSVCTDEENIEFVD